MKCLERKISQCILPLKEFFVPNSLKNLNKTFEETDVFSFCVDWQRRGDIRINISLSQITIILPFKTHTMI